jgi:hypothetical protein
MTDQIKQFTKTLNAHIRVHVEKYDLVIIENDLLIAHDPLTGRIVITFEVVKKILPKAAE